MTSSVRRQPNNSPSNKANTSTQKEVGLGVSAGAPGLPPRELRDAGRGRAEHEDDPQQPGPQHGWGEGGAVEENREGKRKPKANAVRNEMRKNMAEIWGKTQNKKTRS